MGETENVGLAARRISRRAVIAGGVATAGAMWVTPTVSSFSSVAFAGSLNPSAPFSYVTLLLETENCTPNKYYRIKYDSNFWPTTPPPKGTCVTVPAPTSADYGSSFTDGGCFGPKSTNDPTNPPNITIVNGLPPGITAQYCQDSTGAFSFQVSNGDSDGTYTKYKVVAWLVHQGNCCADSVNYSKTNYPGPSGNLDSGAGSTLTFPAPGNTASC